MMAAKEAKPPDAGESELPSHGEAEEREAERERRSPRLRQPKHHRILRPNAALRRRMISLAGLMLLVSSALGFYTAAGILAQLGSTTEPALPETPVDLAGRVTDSNGTDIVGATVKVVGTTNQNVTNGDGSYYLEAVKPGTYTLEASKAGYTTQRKTVNVSPGIPKPVDFVINPGSDIVIVPPEETAHFISPTSLVIALGVAVLLASIVAALGALSALTHRRYLVAIVGAAAGGLTIGIFFSGTILGIAALAILGSLKTGFLEAESHTIPWEDKSPSNRRSRMRSR